ncbi:MAG: T9SS type A sorting domain-containing protein [Candidatus Kapabacteria bacterium]|nr:T9SS type A sorting domain-containing protein [Candidatus Kapabacteria bacterium]
MTMRMTMNHRTQLSAAVLWMMLVAVASTAAQETERRGAGAVSEGLVYLVAFPQVYAAPTEKPMSSPMRIHIMSRYTAKVRITNATTDAAITAMDETVTIEPGRRYSKSISLSYMNGVTSTTEVESEEIRGLGIRIESTAPISVYTEQAWMGNGEMTRHVPVEAWGTSYISMNMYQDRYGTVAAGYKNRPSQILIVAAHDSTDVTYVPTIATEGGKSYPSLRAGETRTVRLNAGQTFIIKDRIVADSVRRTSTDLSGTTITASKPVAVISGTTKAAIARMPDVLPPTGMFAAESHFVRNNVHDVLMPTSMAGTSFITVPTMYTPTRRPQGALPQYGIDDDRGDVIRFVAVDNNTTITAMRADGQGMRTVATLQRGQSHLEMVVDQATYWEASKPVLVGQYGKSFAYVVPPALIGSKGSSEHVLGHPTVEAGMPMLQMVPSMDRAISYGAFSAVEGLDNFLTVVFKTGEESNIRLDGQSTLLRFTPKPISGTPYSYVRTPVTSGEHWLQSVHDSVRWHAWTYGSLDGLQQGRAYGTTLGYDFATSCGDSVVVTDVFDCDASASVELRHAATPCTALLAIAADTLENAELSVDTTFRANVSLTSAYRVTFVDKAKLGRGVIRVQAASGSWVTRTYVYDPKVRAPRVQADRVTATTPPVHIDSLACRTITVRNPTSATANLQSIRLSSGDPGIIIAPSQLQLSAGAQAEVIICRPSRRAAGTVIDTLIATVGCLDQSLGVMRSFFARPTIICQDQDWVDVSPASFGIERQLGIQNPSDVPLTIRGIAGDTLDLAVGHFGNTRGLDTLPIIVPAKSIYNWYVTYSPKGQVGATHTATVRFVSDAGGTDSVAVLRGSSSLTSVDEDEAMAWSISPNPTTGILHLRSPEEVTAIELVDPQGGVMPVPAGSSLDLSAFATGVYTLRVYDHRGVHVRRVILLR